MGRLLPGRRATTLPAVSYVESEPDDGEFRPEPPAFMSGRYEVRYDRVGRHGSTRSALPAPAPLTCIALTGTDLAVQVEQDCRQYLGHGADLQVVVDLVAHGGQIRFGGRPAGTFTLRRLIGGAA